jgi:alcohol dehydrogenase (cytochrome c)
MRLKNLLTGVFAGALLVAVPALAVAADASVARLEAAGTDAEAGNWLMVHKDYSASRHSTLDEINAANVAGLKLAFAVPLGGSEPAGFGAGSMEGTPLAKDGFLYVSDPWGTPYKIDASDGKAGKIAWIGDTSIDKDPSRGILLASRGLALVDNLVITALNDGRVVAFDDETGDVVWDQQVGKEPGEGFTNAPLVVKDMVIVGQSYGDWATRGWIAALDAKTGEEKWRFFTVPAPGEPGSETWLCDQAGNPDCWKTGGAAAWVTGSYDAASNTIYWGTGNPVPMFDPEYRPGDNLYSNSSIALDADTGKLKWHFQYTPGDYMDYDEVGAQLLVDTKVDGEDRKVLAHFGRNGLFYTLDRTNGSFIAANPYVNQLNWTKGIDPKTGKPVEYDSSKSLQEYANGALRRGGATVDTCPNIQGGMNFWPPSFNPSTSVAYGAGIEGCSTLTNKEETATEGTSFSGGSQAGAGAQTGSIFSFDVTTGKQIGKLERPYPNYAGVMTTPDLVWTGELDGTFGAYDAKTLEQKWSINMGGSFTAPPIAFSVGGKEYIAIESGGSALVTFGHPELTNRPPANVLYVFAL